MELNTISVHNLRHSGVLNFVLPYICGFTYNSEFDTIKQDWHRIHNFLLQAIANIAIIFDVSSASHFQMTSAFDRTFSCVQAGEKENKKSPQTL